ncbi:MAG: vitamin B12 dependent-methionine synthase activation domain-containing protein [Coriobacteriales bacterium]|jgi:hypothetical protein
MISVESYDIARLDRGEVLRYLGYAGQPLSDELDGRIDAAIERCLQVARPRGCVAVFDAGPSRELDDGTPVLTMRGATLELRGADIARHMRGASAYGVLAVTLGVGVERELRALSLTDTLGELIFDAAATTCVERAADAAEARLVARAAARRLYTNFRFSPGYGDLPLDTQPALLATLDAQRKLGLSLTKSNLLVPTKSVTAVVGMFTEPQQSSHLGCGTCFCREFCTIRSTTGRTCHGFDA